MDAHLVNKENNKRMNQKTETIFITFFLLFLVASIFLKSTLAKDFTFQTTQFLCEAIPILSPYAIYEVSSIFLMSILHFFQLAILNMQQVLCPLNNLCPL